MINIMKFFLCLTDTSLYVYIRAYTAWFGSDLFSREDGGTKFLRNVAENMLLVTYCKKFVPS